MWQKLCTFSAIYHSWWYTWFNWKILIKRSFRRSVSTYAKFDVRRRLLTHSGLTFFRCVGKFLAFWIFFSRVVSKFIKRTFCFLSQSWCAFSAMFFISQVMYFFCHVFLISKVVYFFCHTYIKRGFVRCLTGWVPVFPDHSFIGQTMTFFQPLPLFFLYLGKKAFLKWITMYLL